MHRQHFLGSRKSMNTISSKKSTATSTYKNICNIKKLCNPYLFYMTTLLLWSLKLYSLKPSLPYHSNIGQYSLGEITNNIDQYSLGDTSLLCLLATLASTARGNLSSLPASNIGQYSLRAISCLCLLATFSSVGKPVLSTC